MAEPAAWVMPTRSREDMLDVVNRTDHSAAQPADPGARARAAAIAVVVVSVIITAIIVVGIHLLRMKGLLA